MATSGRRAATGGCITTRTASTGTGSWRRARRFYPPPAPRALRRRLQRGGTRACPRGSGGCEGRYSAYPGRAYVAVARAEGAISRRALRRRRGDRRRRGRRRRRRRRRGRRVRGVAVFVRGGGTTEPIANGRHGYLRERASEAKVRGFPASGPAAAVTITPGDLRAAGREVCRTAASFARACPEAGARAYLCLDVRRVLALTGSGWGRRSRSWIRSRGGVGARSGGVGARDAVATMEAEAGTDAGW